MTGAQVATRPNIAESLMAEAFYDQINERQLAAIENSLMPGLKAPEIAWVLEMARALNLSPWTKEIMAGKSSSGRLLVMVGRDGLLRKAEDFPDYMGYDADVVHVNDEFRRVEPDAEGKTIRQRAGVVHTYGHPKGRGEIVGAWCAAERRGRPIRYFFADIEEYRPNLSADKLAKSAWGTTTSVMIEKVPISVVHRTLCNLSGIYLEEEVSRMMEPGDKGGRRDMAGEMEGIRAILDGLDCSSETRERLWEGIQALNALRPNSWGLAVAQMTFPGRTEAELAREADTIEGDVRKAQAAADAAEAAKAAAALAEAAPEEEITDAVVVEPGEEEPEPVEAEDGALSEEDQVRESRIVDLEAALENRNDYSDQEIGDMEAQLKFLREA